MPSPRPHAPPRPPLRLARRAACAALAASLLAGCGAGVTGRDPATLVIGAEGEIPPLDPHRMSGTVGLRIVDALYDPLIREDLSRSSDSAPELRPALAESWEVSADARTYTLDLREGVEFSDGAAFDADAVKLNFDRIMAEDSGVFDAAASANMSFVTRWIEKVRVSGPHTLVLELSEPFAGLPRLLSDRRMSIISPSALREHDVEDIAHHPAGTGPFTQESAEQGRRINLERNPGYWGQRPRSPAIIVESVTDPTTLAIAAQTGEVDAILSAGAQQVQQLTAGESMAVQYPEPANQYFIRLNTRIAPTDDARFRRALNYAVDRDAIKELTAGQVRPSDGPVPRGNEVYTDDADSGEGYTHDPEKARELVEESGVRDPRITLLVPESGPGFSQATEIISLIQEDLADVGVELDARYMEFASLVEEEEKGYDDTVHGSFNGWTTGADSAEFLERMFSGEQQPPNGVNRGWYESERVDTLFDRARGETDTRRSTALYRDAAAEITDDAPWVFLYQDRLPRLLSEDITAVEPAASVYIDYTRIGRE